jgi:pimeloyl-ACP methyl ester carboxylesterase
MANIVLAHGILGFGSGWSRLISFGKLRYFNRIAELYHSLGHEVFEPSAKPLGPLDLRSRQLERAIERKWPTEEFSVIAHSMGGLDIRRVLARNEAIRQRVRTVITLSTPYLGSPVMDAVANPSHPLQPHIPAWLIAALGPSFGALQDLRTRTTRQDSDQQGVKYIEIGCDASQVDSRSPLFSLTQAIGGLKGVPNDGLVTLESASVPGRELAEIWPVDHGGAIGWPSGMVGLSALRAAWNPPADHLERYRALLSLL